MIEAVILALVFAALVGGIGTATRRKSALVLALLWLAYAVYEFLMYRRVLCGGECNIRVDLLLIYPLLLGFTLYQFVATVAQAIRRRR